MTAPRIEIRLDHIADNTRTLVGRLAAPGIEVCAVTKATLGAPEIAQVLLDAGAASLGESRIENVEALRRAGVTSEILLVRGPMLSQVDRVVAHVDASLNSEIEVIEALAAAATKLGTRHRVVLMVELGDLREGIMPADLEAAVERVLALPGVELIGIGTNLACQNGIIPDAANMAELGLLARSVSQQIGTPLRVVSGGNSANLNWALGLTAPPDGINQLRLGESILLGREPTRRAAIDGLHTDAFTFVAEVVESKEKPSRPWGRRGQAAFGAGPDDDTAEANSDEGVTGNRILVAAGRQDIDPAGLTPPVGLRLLGASSDHLVLESVSGQPPGVGDEIRFDVDYSALVRAMTSPFVARRFLDYSQPRSA